MTSVWLVFCHSRKGDYPYAVCSDRDIASASMREVWDILGWWADVELVEWPVDGRFPIRIFRGTWVDMERSAP